MINKKIGYASLIFSDISKQEVISWANLIRKEDLCVAEINGKIEGGNLTDKLHLTLFYGFNEEIINKIEISDYLNSIKLKNIEIEGLGFFPVREYDCNVLYLKVKDNEAVIKDINANLAKFPHFSEYQFSQYVPHITVAYIRKDFNADEIVSNFPKSLLVEKAVYISKK